MSASAPAGGTLSAEQTRLVQSCLASGQTGFAAVLKVLPVCLEFSRRPSLLSQAPRVLKGEDPHACSPPCQGACIHMPAAYTSRRTSVNTAQLVTVGSAVCAHVPVWTVD